MKCKYASIDIETTGLDPATCQILEVACVIETDWATPVDELPSLRLLVSHDLYRGEPYALAMHSEILRQHCRDWVEREKDTTEAKYLAHKILMFLSQHINGTPTIAGKNVGMFDMRFLERLPGWDRARIRHRIIDPGMLWFNPATDDRVPDTAECMKRAGVTNSAQHTALADCRAVIEMVRAYFLPVNRMPFQTLAELAS